MTDRWCAAASFLDARGPVAVPLQLCCVQRLLGRAPSPAPEIPCAAVGPAPDASVLSGFRPAVEPGP
jgi:hypothetical protein